MSEIELSGALEHEGQQQTEESGIVEDPETNWIASINDNLLQASKDNGDGAKLWSKHCIYRIPRCLRDACQDDKAYIPQVVSLGPYHHGEKHLCNMEPHKWRALHRILERKGRTIQHYLDEMKALEKKARRCYDEPIMLSPNKFVEMMVLDSAFVYELICGYAGGFQELGYTRHDPIFGRFTPILTMIIRDMIKLENQIPLFLLRSLFGPVKESDICKLLITIFDPLSPTKISLCLCTELPEAGGLHLLQVFRRNLLAGQATQHSSNPHDQRELEDVPCATELKEAGMQFIKGASSSFWDIKYNSGVLEIPQLLIYDGTESLFLNLIAYEQCHMDSTSDIASYVLFMDSLIDKPEDVSYLRNCGIIENWMGSDAVVAELFNRMGQGVSIDVNNYLSLTSRKVNEYHRNEWNGYRASLRRTYFNNPWSIISFIAAVVLLLFTFIQTYLSMYAYFRPPKSPGTPAPPGS